MREWLKDAREEAKLSQEEIGQIVGLKQSSYSMIEIGERRPSVETAKKIAEALGFDWTRFYDPQTGRSKPDTA